MDIYSFYYKKGPIETTTPFNPPTQSVFDQWLKEFRSVPGIEQYDIWLCGSFLQKKWFTWDIDVILSGPRDLDLLEKILIQGHQIACCKYHILIDLQYFSKPCIYPYRNITLTSIVLGKPEGERPSHHGAAKKVSTYLWEIPKKFPSEKQKKRMKTGKTYDIPPRLLAARKQL